MQTQMRGLVWACFLLPAVAGCGSRTGLPGGSPEVSGDGGVLPPIDAAPAPDVVRSDCPSGDPTLVFVVTEEGQLFRFSPPDASFTNLGSLRCPSLPDASPFSMAVNRQGTAFVLYDDGSIFRVSTVDGSCSATSYRPGQNGFFQFGMGFATDEGGPSETLFVADATDQSASLGLGAIDTSTFALSKVASFVDPIARPELTGTGDGRLFIFYSLDAPTSSTVAELDKSTARVIAENQLPGVVQGQAWAFAFWGGDFWLFTAPGGSSQVTRFRPSDGSITAVATLPQLIVGAGVSTCAPP
jgi:hypothetical protein